MAELQGLELQGQGLMSSPLGLGSWSLPGSGSVAVRGLQHRHTAVLCAVSCRVGCPMLVVLRGVGRTWVKEAGALLQLYHGLCFPGRELSPFYQGGSASPALETLGFAVQWPILDKLLPRSSALISSAVQP